MDQFVHLHLHTEWSLLDGACRIDRLVSRVKELGQPAVAITDHGVLYGAIEFYKRCKAEGVHPVIGCEVYVAPRTMYDKVHRLDGSPHHLVLLCENKKGYENLISLVSRASIDGFYNKPRVDMQLLRQKSEGLIALSACLSGQIARLLMQGSYRDAVEAAKAHIEIFGKDNYFIEVQNHGIPEQARILPLQRKLATELGIGLVATNDAHYIEQSDSKMQHVLTCIQTNTTVENSSLEFSTDEFYIKSRSQMLGVLGGFADAVDNTVKIAKRCNLDFEFGRLLLPVFTAPDNQDNSTYFRNKCLSGLQERYGEHPDPEVTARLHYEMDTIAQMGYVDYFLIVHDFIAYARSVGIPVGPGRGSGAGSLCAYCIGITGVDPIKYGLIFERFLNPERISMPDFDIDFCYVRRGEVIDYVVRKYGEQHVAQIITFGTMAARASLRDTGRAMGIAYSVVDAVAKKVPMDLKMTLERALKVSPDFRAIYENDLVARELIDTAKALEGMPRHASTHAAGVVITKEPVEKYVPLQRGEDAIVTQYPMGTLEELGLLKMDFLGLRNLTVIADCEQDIRKHDPSFSMETIPLDDPAVFAMLSKGQTDGVFQFESGGMRQVLSQLKPEYMEDLIAVLSLYRPGPMDSIPTYIKNRHNPKLVTYKHPRLAPILGVTYGCIVYQEQVMQIFRELAGFSYGRADLVRRAMSKKKADVMQEEGEHFVFGMTDEQGNIEVEGCVRRGIPAKIAWEIFHEMSSFAAYAFNKSHAAAYAHVSYQTAYLKCHYPREYMAALLTSVLENTDKMVGYLNECERLGIKILPPDVNASYERFAATDEGIRFGLLAIKNLGRNVVAAIVRQRETEGNYTDFHDFCERLYPFDLRRRPLESLIKSGSLDRFGETRRSMLENCDLVLDNIQRTAQSNLTGQLNLFGETAQQAERLPPREEYDQSTLLAMEKEVLGLFVSGHPLGQYKQLLQKLPITSVAAILEAQTLPTKTLQDDAKASVAVLLSSRKNMITKKGEQMAWLTVEDATGTFEAVAFPKILERYGELLQPDAALLLSGRLSYREDEPPKILIEEARSLSSLSQPKKRHKPGLYLRMFAPPMPDQVGTLLQRYPGTLDVYVYFEQGETLTKAPDSLRVDPHEELLATLHSLLGEQNVIVREG